MGWTKMYAVCQVWKPDLRGDVRYGNPLPDDRGLAPSLMIGDLADLWGKVCMIIIIQNGKTLWIFENPQDQMMGYSSRLI